MTNLILSNGVGRFGNKIRQLLHVFFVCEQYGFTLSYQDFDCEFVTLRQSEFYRSFDPAADNLFDKNSFFWLKDLCHYCRMAKNLPTYVDALNYPQHFCYLLSLNEYLRLADRYLKKMTDVKPIRVADTTCVIHLRSGDVFDKPNFLKSMHGGYTQPPLAFYRKLIREEPFESYVVLTEADRGNPCVDQLAKSPNVEVQCGSFAEDLGIMLGASNLVFSNSTLCFAVMCLSEQLKNVLVCKDLFWDFKASSVKTRFNVVRYALKDYIGISDWLCSEEQLALMLHYPETNVEKIHENV